MIGLGEVFLRCNANGNRIAFAEGRLSIHYRTWRVEGLA